MLAAGRQCLPGPVSPICAGPGHRIWPACADNIIDQLDALDLPPITAAVSQIRWRQSSGRAATMNGGSAHLDQLAFELDWAPSQPSPPMTDNLPASSMFDYDARPVTPQVVLVGSPVSADGYAIRDFLSRNRFPTSGWTSTRRTRSVTCSTSARSRRRVCRSASSPMADGSHPPPSSRWPPAWA